MAGFGFRGSSHHLAAAEAQVRRPLGKSKSALSTELSRYLQQQAETDSDIGTQELIRAEVDPASASSSAQVAPQHALADHRSAAHRRLSLDNYRPATDQFPTASHDSSMSPARRVPLRRATATSFLPQERSSPLQSEGHMNGPGDKAFVPPHLLSSSLPAWETPVANPFKPGSVMVGNGRKLRGYDADRFKREIMRQTGFLEEL